MPDSPVQSSTPLSASLARMAGVLFTEETLDSILDLICALARDTITGSDGVSTSLVRDGKLITAAYSNELMDRLDRLQYELGEGPCVWAVKKGTEMHAPALADDDRWPAFASRAAAEGVTSMLSLPLMVDDESVGALNIYSTSEKSLEGSQDIGRMFAKQAAVVLANAHAYSNAEKLNDQLQEALKSREIIGEAKGILMEREGCSSEESFAMLRRLSQHSNRKLRDVAQDVIDSIARPNKSGD